VEAACGRKELSNALKVIPFWLGFGILSTVVHIKFYANMRTIAGGANLDIPYSNAKTLRQLLAILKERLPGIHYNLMDQDGNLRQDVPIFVNGRNPRLDGAGINMPLAQDDEICLFSPISSGRMNVEAMRPSGLEKDG
jgi:MoaD family protein